MNISSFKCCARDKGVYPSLFVSFTKFFNFNSSIIYFAVSIFLFFVAKCNKLSLLKSLTSKWAPKLLNIFKISKVFESDDGPTIAKRHGVHPEYSFVKPNFVFLAFFSLVVIFISNSFL